MRTDCVCQSKLCVYQSNGHKDTFFGRIDTSFRIDGNVEMRDRTGSLRKREIGSQAI